MTAELSKVTGVQPRRPEHADREYPIPGADPRLALRRHLTGYAYPANGNLHNPTPEYRWMLLVDGRVVDSDARKGPLVRAAREDGAEYLADASSAVSS